MRGTRILLVGDGTKAKVRAAVSRASRWLRGRQVRVVRFLDREADLGDVEGDLLVVFGGDGSILSAARRLRGNSIPTLGVNLGKLGFMAGTPMGELRQAIPRILDGDLTVRDLMMLEGRIEKPAARGRPRVKNERWTLTALNDCVLSSRAIGRMTMLRLKIDGQVVTAFRGDGLIVSTPSGSTAHSLSAGGPILHPEVRALVITPLCPHTLSNRPIVVEGTSRLELTLVPPPSECNVTLDGQVSLRLQERETLHVRRSRKSFRLVRAGDSRFYAVLREKLRWGILPRYRDAKGIESWPR